MNGTIPSWLYSFPSLQVILWCGNHFTGQHKEFQSHSLVWLSIAWKRFFGLFPISILISTSRSYIFGSVIKSLQWFCVVRLVFWIRKIFTTTDCSQNNFEGEIPKSIGVLKSLKGLKLSHNKLTALIPPLFGNFSELEWPDHSLN